MRSRNLHSLALTLFVASQTVVAGTVDGLTTFTSGTPARAAEVNGNFSAVKAAVDGNAADIDALEATVTSLQSTIATLESTLNTVQSQVTTLQINAAGLQSAVTALQSTVVALERGPRAYAVVELRYDADTSTADPLLVAERTKNFDAVRRSGFTPAYYCLTPSASLALDPATTATIVSPDYGLTNGLAGDKFLAYVDTTSRECEPGEFAVVMNTPNNAGRSLISFSFIVP